MTVPAWLADVRQWVAPPPAWAFVARDRDGYPVSTAARLLLALLWSLGDAPSKRAPGHHRVEHRDLQQQRLALLLSTTVRTPTPSTRTCACGCGRCAARLNRLHIARVRWSAAYGYGRASR